MSPEVLVQLDDQPEPMALDDLSWELLGPCGCTYGCMVVENADADAAAVELHGGREQARRKAEDGYVLQLRPRAEVMERIKPPRVECTHWKERRIVVPDGHRWAERDDSRRAHLVPDATVREWTQGHWSIYDVLSICDRIGPRPFQQRRSWHDPDHDWPQCRRCQQWAREQAAAGAEATS